MWRAKIVFAGFVIFAGLIGARLFYWQILSQGKLLALAESQYLQILEVPASRGEIQAQDSFPLATNQQAFLVFASIPDLKDKPKEIAQKLAPILADFEIKSGEEQSEEEVEKINQEKLKAKEKELEEKLATRDVVWVALVRKIDKDKKEKIENLKIAGIGFREEEKRFYPEASMAAHLLGFVGSDAKGQDQGYFGLEGYYNGQLKGRPGIISQEKDATGKPILLGSLREVEPKNGRTLVTTVDRTVQLIAEEKLKKGIEKYGAKGGSVVILDPKTGQILAMASEPSYDPTQWQKYKEEDFKNPVVADSFEPGSIFKLVAMSAALNEGVVKPDTICDKCDGPREIGGFTIRTWNNKYYPNSTATQILEHSDNVGMVFVAEKLGLNRYLRYLKKYGFGESSGIDLQEEAVPEFRPSNDWKPIDLAVASFGQGIAVTPIQMARVVATIANGGELVTPYAVSKIVGEDRVFENKPKIVRRVISQETTRVLTEMMVNAVENGEARYFAPKGYKIAGKTGTAQIPIAGHYDPHKTIASFVGFAPADDPKFAMLVRYVQPSSSPYGSETAAPTFFEIAKELFAYWGIPPKS
jgi:cell division protein FtsI/penicillin-binding protein 2